MRPSIFLTVWLCISVMTHSGRAEEPDGVTVLSPGIPCQLDNFRDQRDSVEFVVEANGLVRLRVSPRAMPVRSGEAYSVNTSFFGPSIVYAEEDGVLQLQFDRPRHCTVVIEPLPGPNLIAPNSFEKVAADREPAGWEDAGEPLADGRPAGADTIVEEEARTGHKFLRLRHSSAFGLTALRTTVPMPVEPGQTYLLSAWYRAPKTPFGARLLLMATLKTADQRPEYRIDSEPFVATRAGAWRRVFQLIDIPSDWPLATADVTLGVSGAGVTVDFDDVELRRAPRPAVQSSKPLASERRRVGRQRDALEQLWRERVPVAVEPPTAGKPLRLDAQVEPLYWLASDYWPSGWRAKTAHRDFAEAGVRLQAIPLHARSPRGDGGAWKGDDDFDFSVLDDNLAYILGLDDSIRVILYASIIPDREFCDRHPEAAWTDADGRQIVGAKEAARDASTRKPGEPLQHSLTAAAFRQGGSQYLQALARHLNQTPLGHAVVGVHLVGGTDGQWFKPDWRPGASDYDYSPGAVEAFRDWLRRRYSDDLGKLQQAWGDSDTTFARATLPNESERAPDKWFLNPALGRDCRVIDANLFSDAGKMETVTLFAKDFKQALKRPVFVTSYLHNKLHGNRTWMESPWLDGTIAVEEYALWRGLGNTGEIATYPGSLRLHDKFFVQELDYRTENAETWGSDAQDFARHVWNCTFGPAEGVAQLRRDLGASLAQGGGAWHYCLMGNSWNHLDHMANIAEARRVANSVATGPTPLEPAQIAVFFDDNTEHYATQKNLFGPLIRHHGYYAARYALSRSGLTWDSYLLSDLGHPRLPNYRAYLFLTSGGLTAEQIRFIRERLQRDGKVLYFAYHAGWFADGGFEHNVHQLTGMQVRVERDPVETGSVEPDSHGTAHRFVRTGDDPLADGVEELLHSFRGPQFFVDDPTATPLATLSDTSQIGLAVKRHSDWTAVYSALPGGFTPRLLRNLAHEAGLEPIGPEDDVTYAGNGLLVLHALSDGKKTLHWQGRSDVIDLATNQTVAEGVQQLTVPMQASETRWFRVTPCRVNPNVK